MRAIAFAAMGTAGQRCTTLRRLFVSDAIYQQFLPRLSEVYASVGVGDPRSQDTLVGPLIDRSAFESMERALAEVRAAGGTSRAANVSGGSRAMAPIMCVRPYVKCRTKSGPYCARRSRQFSM